MGEHAEIRWHVDPVEVDLNRDTLLHGVKLLQQGRADGLHEGAQVYVGRYGQPVLEYAIGEAAPGTPMTADSVAAWFSASKPVVALAIALLYDRGKLDLDDRVVDYIREFRYGKEACTLRHVLTHQGGFANAIRYSDDKPWDELIAAICVHPAEYVPGSKAGYHSTSAWYILAEVLRRVDGRPIDRFVTEELFAPLGIGDSAMGISVERQAELAGRLARVQLGRSRGEPYANEAFVNRFNSQAEIVRVNPSGGIRGPARDLGRFYDWLLCKGEWDGHTLVDRRTVELFTACHRWGMTDITLAGAPLAWGLGFGKHGNADVDRSYSRRVFNHSGMVSSVALGDPAFGLSCAVITTGLLDPVTNARRLRAVTGTAVAACTDDRARRLRGE